MNQKWKEPGKEIIETLTYEDILWHFPLYIL